MPFIWNFEKEELIVKFTVLNGSPKGDLSVTMHYVYYVQKKNPEHQFQIHNISMNINKIIKKEEAFNAILEDITSSDGLIWAFPVYKGLVPSQYMQFIERISEPEYKEIFQNKHTVVLTTSARVFDHTAHNYARAICDDLDMKFVDFYSADYDDLTKEV